MLTAQYNKDYVCLRRKGQALSLSVIKDSLSSGFLSCDAAYYTCRRYLPLFTWPPNWELGLEELAQMNANALATAIAMGN